MLVYIYIKKYKCDQQMTRIDSSYCTITIPKKNCMTFS